MGGQGFMNIAEMRHVLTCLGEKLTDEEVDEIMTGTDTREDPEGNIKFADSSPRSSRARSTTRSSPPIAPPAPLLQPHSTPPPLLRHHSILQLFILDGGPDCHYIQRCI